GNIVWSASYDVHGFASIDVEEVRNPLRFQGQYFDQETNLHYNLARYYDPKLGRFIQQDPISIAGGINHYQYAVNPIQWIDPTGFLCEEGLKRLQQMLAEYQAQSDVPQEVCDQILEAAKESSVGEDGVRSQVKIRKPNGKNNIRYEYDLDHIDCKKNEITFYRHINYSDGSKRKIQYTVGIEGFVDIYDFVNVQKCDAQVYDTKTSKTVGGRKIINSEFAGKTVTTKGGDVRFDSDGFPDFTPYSKKTVRVIGLTGDMANDVPLAMARAKITKYDKSKYVWHHHQDGKTMMLIPKSVHSVRNGGVAHTGGRSVIQHNLLNPNNKLNYSSPEELV
ncbi:HNH endonuclease, partial [Vibrio parahaemolyticus]